MTIYLLYKQNLIFKTSILIGDGILVLLGQLSKEKINFKGIR